MHWRRFMPGYCGGGRGARKAPKGSNRPEIAGQGNKKDGPPYAPKHGFIGDHLLRFLPALGACQASENQPKASGASLARSGNKWRSRQCSGGPLEAMLGVDVDDNPVLKVWLIGDWQLKALGIFQGTFDHPIRLIAEIHGDWLILRADQVL